jgi:Xaa-Pro aminopeptidase
VSEPVSQLPHPADFAAPPTPADLARWEDADRSARPARVERLRKKMAAEKVDGYFGVRSEHTRYLTGFALGDGEDRVAGNSGRFLVGGAEIVLLADSRYRLQATAQAPDTRVEPVTYDLAAGWAALVEGVGAKRVAVEAGHVSYQEWEELRKAAPDVELVPVSGWVEADRAVKEPAELERVRAACAVADRALAAIVRRIKPGMTERTLALALEWEMRNGGAEALAFDVACLAGANAALPHGSPSESETACGQVLLFDFGAMVAGYRSDMTRTLFVGEPGARDLEIYHIVAAAQGAAIEILEAAARGSRAIPSGREADAAARAVIEAAGHGDHFGHGTGHGIGLATHELPSLSKAATEDPLPGPTVFSVEPGIYLDGETGVRIEDLVLFDPAGNRCERLTSFPREVIAVAV